MVKRAGLPEAPDGRVVTPNLAGGAHSSAAQAFDDLARTARQIGDVVQPAVDSATAKRARKAVAQGNYTPSGGITRQDEIFDKVIDAGFMAQGAIDVDAAVAQLETEHLATLDIDKFTEQNEAARSAYLEQIDERYAVTLGQEWDKRAYGAKERLTRTATAKATARAQKSLEARQGLLLDNLSGASNPYDPEVDDRLSELLSVIGARVANPMDDFSQQEGDVIYAGAVSKMEANRIGDEALAYFEESGMSDEAYAASLKTIDDALADPNLALSRTERSSYLGSARQALNGARSEARRAEREVEQEIRAAEARAAAEFSVEMGDAGLRASEGHAPDAAEIADLYRLAASTGRSSIRLLAKVDRLAMTAGMQAEMRGLSVPQQEAYVGALEQRAARGDREAALALDSAKKVASATRSAAVADPATFAALSEGRDPPRIDWQAPAGPGETMTARFIEAEEGAKSLGVGVQYFSPADRGQLRSLAEAGGKAALAVASEIVQSSEDAGIDPMRPLAEIGGDSAAPLLSVAGGLIAQGVPSEAAAMIMAGVEVMRTDVVKGKMPSQAAQRAAQKRVLGGQMERMDPKRLDAMTRAADAHFAATVVARGGDASSSDYGKSLQAVMGEWQDESGRTFGGRASASVGLFESGTVTVPSWVQQSKFMTLVRSLTAAEIGAMGGQAAFVGQKPATVQDIRAAFPQEAAPGLYYMFTKPPKPGVKTPALTDAYGEIMLFDFNAARSALKGRDPDAVR